MQLGKSPVGWLLVALLSATGCDAVSADTPAPAASSTPVVATTPTRPAPSTPTAPQPTGKRIATPEAYNPYYCGVTSQVKGKGPSSALLTIDDFPYQDGSVIVKVAAWAKQTNTMMHAFPIAQEINAYNKQHRTDIVARARALGTYVSNHTYSHGNLARLSAKEAHAQITRGVKSTYVRPPYGAYNTTVREFIEDNQKARVCHWTIDTMDWQKLANGKYPSAPLLAQRVRKQLTLVKRGEPIVILGHYHTNYPAALPAIRAELVRSKARVCETPPGATTANVPYPIC